MSGRERAPLPQGTATLGGSVPAAQCQQDAAVSGTESAPLPQGVATPGGGLLAARCQHDAAVSGTKRALFPHGVAALGGALLAVRCQQDAAVSSTERAPLADAHQIAVLRPNALGDFVFCLPALHALKQCYPAARLLYIGLPWHAAFLEGRPGPVDAVAVMPPHPGMGVASREETDARAIDVFVGKLRACRIDLAVQMFGGGRHANPFIRRLGARLAVGMCAGGAEPLDRNVRHDGLVNRRLQLLEVAALAGAAAWPMRRELHVTLGDLAQAARLLPEGNERPLVLLQPGASDPRRRWPLRRFAALGDLLAREGALVAVNGSLEEAHLVRELIEAMQYPAIDLGGKASLAALCGILARSALVVSNDTGPLHLALALGTPAVGIYWLTNLIESGPLRQEGHRAAVSLRVHCAVCGEENIKRRCAHDASFVDAVTQEEVNALALGLLHEKRSRDLG